MNGPPSPKIGPQLYALMPEVYRTEDKGDLKCYLDAFGDVLDRVHATIEQRRRDLDPQTWQSWLIPYAAQLVDARPVSPDAEGQSLEVQRAVSWRQRKGTAASVEEIAETVGRMEVEVQEGWKRVTMTPRIGVPLLPARALGDEREPDRRNPLAAIRHPGLPSVTPDLRYASRAEQAAPDNPVARVTRFNEQPVRWRQANPWGVPCFPGSYEDVSRRTPDLRTPAWDRGHHHARRLLVHTPPPAGFFLPGAAGIPWTDRGNHPAVLLLTDETRSDGAGGSVRVRSFIRHPGVAQPVRITGVITLGEDTSDREDDVYRFEGLHLADTVTVKKGTLEIARCAAEKVVVHKAGTAVPVLTAVDSLLKNALAASGLARFEYCTVMEDTVCEALQASDCIFLEPIRKDLAGNAPPAEGCIRYSRVAPGWVPGNVQLYRGTVVNESPFFFTGVWGKPGCGVLHPATPESICAGAEDGGEMGAFHHLHYCLRRAAMAAKLRDYLPLGIEPVVIPDPRLSSTPPR